MLRRRFSALTAAITLAAVVALLSVAPALVAAATPPARRAATTLAGRGICFGAKSDSFAMFRVHASMLVTEVRLDHVSGGGVSCNTNVMRTPTAFTCLGDFAIVLACSAGAIDAEVIPNAEVIKAVTGGFVAAMREDSTGGSAVDDPQSVVLTVGAPLEEGQWCGVAYREDYFDVTEDDNSDTGTCVDVWVNYTVLHHHRYEARLDHQGGNAIAYDTVSGVRGLSRSSESFSLVPPQVMPWGHSLGQEGFLRPSRASAGLENVHAGWVTMTELITTTTAVPNSNITSSTVSASTVMKFSSGWNGNDWGTGTSTARVAEKTNVTTMKLIESVAYTSAEYPSTVLLDDDAHPTNGRLYVAATTAYLVEAGILNSTFTPVPINSSAAARSACASLDLNKVFQGASAAYLWALLTSFRNASAYQLRLATFDLVSNATTVADRFASTLSSQSVGREVKFVAALAADGRPFLAAGSGTSLPVSNPNANFVVCELASVLTASVPVSSLPVQVVPRSSRSCFDVTGKQTSSDGGEDACASDSLCWRASTGFCCWRQSARVSLEPKYVVAGGWYATQECSCRAALPASAITSTGTQGGLGLVQSANPTCRVDEAQGSSLLLRHMVGKVCAERTARMNDEVSRAACDREFTSGCPSAATGDTPSLLNAALEERCEANGFASASCIDSSLQCTPITHEPTPLPGQNWTGSRAFSVIPGRVVFHTNEVIHNMVFLELHIENEQLGPYATLSSEWNITAVRETVVAAFVPLAVPRFGFDAPVAVGKRVNQSVVLLSAVHLLIGIGPQPGFSPDTFHQTVLLVMPDSWFKAAPTEPLDPIALHFYSDLPSEQVKDSVSRSVASLAGIAVLSGTSGWMGLTSLQTLVLTASARCGEPTVEHYFKPSDANVVSPLEHSGVGDVDSQIIVLLPALFGVLLVHAVLVVLHHKLLDPCASRATSADKLRFPSPYLFLSTCLFTGTSHTTFATTLKDVRPTIRILAPTMYAIHCAVLFLFWIRSIRKGVDGQFIRRFKSSETFGNKADALREHRGLDDDTAFEEKKKPWHERLVSFLSVKLVPVGYWPSVRRFGIGRSIFHDKACYFGVVSVFILGFVGGDTAHRNLSKEYCYALYWNLTAFNVFHFVAFLFFLPFRLPVLNFLFFVYKVIEIILDATLTAYAMSSNMPESWSASAVFPLSIAMLVTMGVFIACTFVLAVSEWVRDFRTWKADRCRRIPECVGGGVSNSPSSAERKRIEGSPSSNADEAGIGGALSVPQPTLVVAGSRQELLADSELQGYMNMIGQELATKGLCSGGIRCNSGQPVPKQTAAAHVPPNPLLQEKRHHHQPPSSSALENVRTVLCIGPMKDGMHEEEVLLIFDIFGAIDVDLIGPTAFVGFPKRSMCVAAMDAFEGRLFHGQSVTCKIIEDDSAANKDVSALEKIKHFQETIISKVESGKPVWDVGLPGSESATAAGGGGGSGSGQTSAAAHRKAPTKGARRADYEDHTAGEDDRDVNVYGGVGMGSFISSSSRRQISFGDDAGLGGGGDDAGYTKNPWAQSFAFNLQSPPPQ